MMIGFDGGMGLGGWLWVIGGIALMVTLIGLLIGALQGRGGPAEDPRRILKDRLARGEISPTEYEQARRLLGI